MEEKLKDELEKAKCIIKLLEGDIEDLRNTLERKVEEVYPEFMKDYKIMRDELNACYDELTEEKKYSETTIKALEGRIAEYERNLDDGELVSTEWHDEQVAILLCERDSLANYAELLKKENAELKSKSSYKDSWKNKFFKAQEEVERLREERENMQAVIFALEEDKRLLQKQVKELKEWRFMHCTTNVIQGVE